MAILVATFFNLKPEVTDEQRNNLAKRGQEVFKKYDFVDHVVPFAAALAGTKYSYVSIVEYPNYAAIDKVGESPELTKYLAEFFANCGEVYQMMFRNLPIP